MELCLKLVREALLLHVRRKRIVDLRYYALLDSAFRRQTKSLLILSTAQDSCYKIESIKKGFVIQSNDSIYDFIAVEKERTKLEIESLTSRNSKTYFQ